MVWTVKVWPQEAIPTLQNCFETTQLDIFGEAATHGGVNDVQEYRESVNDYIDRCTDDVTVVKKNPSSAVLARKPWGYKLWVLLRASNAPLEQGMM